MSVDLKDLETTPTLSLDPFGEAEKEPEVPAAPAPEAVKPAFDESILNDDERKMVDSFAKQIDLTNNNMILQYGAGAQKKMADFSEAALENVRTKDLGEVGDMLSSVVTELKSFDAAEEQEKGFFGFFKKNANKLDTMKNKYDKAEENVTKIVKALKELSMYILAGKKKLQEVRENDLKELMEKAERSGLPEDAQEAKDLDSFCNRFEKKLHDLELTRMISLQTAPQIRLVQGNDTQMVEKIQSTVVNTIPLWKSQMVLALGVEHSRQAAQSQREVTDMTNELLKKNAQTLKMATIETAKESERGIVDIETLKQTNESLISTLDEVLKIQAEGHEKRQAAEAEMQRLEGELKNKLLEIRR